MKYLFILSLFIIGCAKEHRPFKSVNATNNFVDTCFVNYTSSVKNFSTFDAASVCNTLLWSDTTSLTWGYQASNCYINKKIEGEAICHPLPSSGQGNTWIMSSY
jgi:hypothetical protein